MPRREKDGISEKSKTSVASRFLEPCIARCLLMVFVPLLFPAQAEISPASPLECELRASTATREVISTTPMWVTSWDTNPSHGKTLQQPQADRIEGRKKKKTHKTSPHHISSNNNQQLKLCLRRRKGPNCWDSLRFYYKCPFPVFVTLYCLKTWMHLSPMVLIFFQPFPTALVTKAPPTVPILFQLYHIAILRRVQCNLKHKTMAFAIWNLLWRHVKIWWWDDRGRWKKKPPL